MQKTRPVANVAMLVLTAAVLYGCGGSSGGPAVAPNPPPPNNPTGAVITTTSAPTITAGVFSGILTAEFSSILSIPPTGPGAPPVPAKPQSSVMTVDPASAVDCPVSGQFSATMTDASFLNLTSGILVPGDAFSFGWDNCDENNGEITDGNIDIAVTSFSGDLLANVYLLGSDLIVDAFSVTLITTNETNTLNADVSVELDFLNFPASTVTTVSGGLIDDENETGAGITLTNFTVSTIADQIGADIQFTTSGNGTLASTDFAGDATFTIEVPFVSIGNANSTEGRLRIDGAEGSNIIVTPLDADRAQLLVDPGDGSGVQTLARPWSDLLL